MKIAISKIGPINKQHGRLVTSDEAKANILIDFFVKIGQEMSEKFTQEKGNKNSFVHMVAPSTDILVLNEGRLRTKLRKLRPKRHLGQTMSQKTVYCVA